MRTPRSIWAICLAVLAAGAPDILGPAPAFAADELQCNKCVDTKDVANRAVTRKRIRRGAVNASRLRDNAVTPEKWALRLFDAGNREVGPLDAHGRVLLRPTGGAQAGVWFSLNTRRTGFIGRSVVYALDDCMGQAYISASDGSSLPVRAGAGPDPATGAIGGVPVRLVAFLANNPDGTPSAGIPVESQSQFDSTTGQVICADITGNRFNLLTADVVDDPDLSSFTPPFRAGVK